MEQAGTKSELVNKGNVAASKPRRSESLESLYNPYATGGACGYFQQEVCLISISGFFLLLGITLTFLAVFFTIQDLYILGVPMLILGAVVLMVGLVFLGKKIKQRQRVSSHKKAEKEEKDIFSNIKPQTQVRKQEHIISNGLSPQTSVTAGQCPAEMDLYWNNNKNKNVAREVIVEDLAHYEPNVGSKRSRDTAPKVFFPNYPVDGDQSTFTTSLAKLQESPQKTQDSNALNMMGHSRENTEDSFASEPVLLDTSPKGDLPNVPDAASYTPISLTKFEIKNYENYGGAEIT